MATVFSERPLGHGHMRADPKAICPLSFLFRCHGHVDSEVPSSSGTLTWWLGAPRRGVAAHGHMCEVPMPQSPRSPGVVNTWTLVDGVTGDLLTASWVKLQEVLRVIDTCGKPPRRYPLAPSRILIPAPWTYGLQGTRVIGYPYLVARCTQGRVEGYGTSEKIPCT